MENVFFLNIHFSKILTIQGITQEVSSIGKYGGTELTL